MHIVIYHRPYHHVSPCISLCITLHIIMYHRAYHHVTDQCDQREFYYFKKPNFFICLNAKKSTFCPIFFFKSGEGFKFYMCQKGLPRNLFTYNNTILFDETCQDIQPYEVIEKQFISRRHEMSCVNLFLIAM